MPLQCSPVPPQKFIPSDAPDCFLCCSEQEVNRCPSELLSPLKCTVYEAVERNALWAARPLMNRATEHSERRRQKQKCCCSKKAKSELLLELRALDRDQAQPEFGSGGQALRRKLVTAVCERGQGVTKPSPSCGMIIEIGLRPSSYSLYRSDITHCSAL